MTLDALRAGITPTALVAAVAELHTYADDAQAIVRDEYRPRIDCREACSFCCCKPGIRVLVPELLRILDHVRTRFDEPSRRTLRDRARRYATQVEGRDVDAPSNESVPCPLLVDECCSVYEVRPLVCRGYDSTSVEAPAGTRRCDAARPDFRDAEGRDRWHDGGPSQALKPQLTCVE